MKNMTSSNFIYKWNTHNLKLQLPSAVYLATDKTYQHFIWLSKYWLLLVLLLQYYNLAWNLAYIKLTVCSPDLMKYKIVSKVVLTSTEIPGDGMRVYTWHCIVATKIILHSDGQWCRQLC